MTLAVKNSAWWSSTTIQNEKRSELSVLQVATLCVLALRIEADRGLMQPMDKTLSSDQAGSLGLTYAVASKPFHSSPIQIRKLSKAKSAGRR